MNRRYLIARIAYALSLWAGVVVATFLLFHVVPSDPARTMLGPNASAQQVDTLRRELGLDQALHRQLTDYFGSAVRFDFGRSFVDRRPVGEEVAQRLAVTATLAGLATSFTVLYLLLCIALGSQLPRLIRVLNTAWVAGPTLFSAMVLALLAVQYYPYTRFSGRDALLGDLLFLLPPALALALYPMGVLGRILDAEFSDLLRSDFVRTARSLGQSEPAVRYRHMLRNALVPLIAAYGVQLPLLLTNTFVVEVIFSVPGVGTLLLRSVLERDLPMLTGIAIAMAAFVLLLYLLLDVLYAVVDPRIGRARDG